MSRNLIDSDRCPHCKQDLERPVPRVCPRCGGSLQRRYMTWGCLSSAPRLLVFGALLAWVVRGLLDGAGV